MEICLEINGQPLKAEISVGMLLSEFLGERGLTDEKVWLDGLQVRPALMLAAQAHGRKVSQTGAVLEPVLIPAEPTGVTC